MKQSFVFAVLIFAFSATAFAQQGSAAIIGKWSGQFPGPDGQPPVKFSMTITENTYQMDMGVDGKVDVAGAYTSDGNQVTIWDTAGENICPSDQKGVYAFTLNGDTLTFTKVSDTCPGRGDAPLVVKRM